MEVETQPNGCDPGAEGAEDSPTKTSPGSAARVLKTPEQCTALETAFLMDTYPSDMQYQRLAESLELTYNQVRDWFAKRRRKIKECVPLSGLAPEAEGGSPGGEAPTASPTNAAELLNKLIEKAKKALPVEFRDDGPPLALNFDDLPTGKRRRGGGDGAGRKRRATAGGVLFRLREEERARKREEIELRRREQEAIRRERAAEKEAEKAHRMQQKLEMLERRERERLAKLEEKRQREEELMELRRAREEEKARARLLKQQQREEAKKKREEELQERKRLKEFYRLKAAEERAQARLLLDRRRALPDDVEVEIEQLRKDGALEGNAGDELPVGFKLPQFPPAGVKTLPLFSKETDLQATSDIVTVWKFISDYSEVINVKPFELGELYGHIECGTGSKRLAQLHLALLKLLQADMEEAHSLVNQEEGLDHRGGNMVGMDRAVSNFSVHLLEAWEWHFNNDILRAQSNSLTWPEVLRQFLIILGYGPERPRPESKKVVEEEEAEEGKTGDGVGPKLVPPATCRPGTIKGSAWSVLAEAGAEGLDVTDIVQRMNEQGLRGPSSSKQPESSMSSALSRDSFVFERVGKSKFALRVICSWHRRQEAIAKKKEAGEEVDDDNNSKEKNKTIEVKDEKPSIKQENTSKGEDDSDDDGEDHRPKRLGEPWVKKLAQNEYNKLTLADRAAILVALCNSVMECPSFYQEIDAALDEKENIIKELRELSRQEKKLKSVVSADADEVKDADQLQAEASFEATKKEMVNRLRVLTDQTNRAALGEDRRYNRYHFMPLYGKSENGGPDAVLIEKAEDRSYQIVQDKESLNLLANSLNPAGFRENYLSETIQFKLEEMVSSMPSSSVNIVEVSSKNSSTGSDDEPLMTDLPTEAMLICLKDNIKPPSTEVQPAGKKGEEDPLLTKLKGDMLDVHEALPTDSLDDNLWDGSDVWEAKVRSATRVHELRDILAEFEGALKDSRIDKDGFPARTPMVIPGAWGPRDAAMDEEDEDGDQEMGDQEEEEDHGTGYVADAGDLSWLPPTTAALQFRLRCLDAALTYRRTIKAVCKRLDAYKYIQRDDPLNKDGTNFTVISATGQAKVMQNYRGRRVNRSAFPSFPEKVILRHSGSFMLPFYEFRKQLQSGGFIYGSDKAVVGLKGAKASAAGKGSNGRRISVKGEMNGVDKGDESDGEFYVEPNAKEESEESESSSEESEVEENDDEEEWKGD